MLTSTRSPSFSSRFPFMVESVSDRLETDPLAAVARFVEVFVVVGA